jgi:hypothetical protein
MESLCRPPRFGIESLRGSALGDGPSRSSVMLDIAFVALGCVILALMGVYAYALRQL